MKSSSKSLLPVLVTLTTLLCAATAPAAEVLRVGTSGDYSPFSFHDVTGALTGFDIAVARRLAADLGRGVVFVPFRWPELVTQMSAGAFDVAMSGVTVRADRALHVAFSRPYMVTGAVVVVRVHGRTRFRRLADVNRPGVRVAVNAGGHLEQVARQRLAHAQLVPVTDNTALPAMLRRGAVDAAVSEALEARTWSREEFRTLGPFTHDRKAYVVSRAAPDLLRQINDWLAAREADGWLDQQRLQWFGAATTWGAPRAAFEAVVAAMDLRLQLMPLVAAVKRREGLPIEDAAQEARVLAHVREHAAASGLNADAVAALFEVQVSAAKVVEREAKNSEPGPDLTLAEVRGAVGAASDEQIAELARCRPWLSDPRFRAQLDATVRSGLSTPALPVGFVAHLIEALHRIR